MTKNEPDRAAREPSTGGKRLVLVVHGLGDSTPGETVGSLTRAMATASARSRVPTDEVRWLAAGSGRQIESFACHVERLRGDGGQTVLAEVCWADLSRVGHGMLVLLLGLFRGVFGLHQAVVRHAADPARGQGRGREPVALVFRWLSLGIAYLLRGPAVAAMLLWALYVASSGIWVLAGGYWELPAENPAAGDDQSRLVLGLSVATYLVGLAVGILGSRWRRGRPHRELFHWLALFGLINLPFWLLSPWYPQPLSSRRPWLGALNENWVMSFQQTQLLTAIVLLLILLATVPWLIARFRAPRGHRPGLDAAQALNYLTFGAWLLLVHSFTVLVLQKAPAEMLPPSAVDLMGQLASNIAFNSIVGLIIVSTMIVTVGLWWRWGTKNEAMSYRASRPAPRLILGGAVLYSLICMPVALFTLNVLAPEHMKALWELLERLSQIVPAAVALIAFVAIYLSEGLHFAIDFILDFVSHFERQRSGADGKLEFVKREHIRDRLRIVMKTLIRQEQPDRLTVLAHSQGTVVAIEALAEGGAGELLEPLTRCDLVTMGSPFHHIYQHYFPNDYPPLSDERWDNLRQRVDRWINIFRIDDYMGTDIDPGGEWPENCPVDAKGHMNYWSDRQVLQILHDRQLV